MPTWAVAILLVEVGVIALAAVGVSGRMVDLAKVASQLVRSTTSTRR